MKCANCGEPTAYISRSTRAFGEGDNLIIVENVPVVACHECGAEYLSILTFGQIEQLHNNRSNIPTRAIPVATFQDQEDPALADLAEVAA